MIKVSKEAFRVIEAVAIVSTLLAIGLAVIIGSVLIAEKTRLNGVAVFGVFAALLLAGGVYGVTGLLHPLPRTTRWVSPIREGLWRGAPRDSEREPERKLHDPIA